MWQAASGKYAFTVDEAPGLLAYCPTRSLRPWSWLSSDEPAVFQEIYYLC